MGWQHEQALLASDIERVRRFDLYYDRRLRDLQTRALKLEFTWLELRLVQELGVAGCGCCVSWIAERVDRDKGYVSRVLKALVEGFEFVEMRKAGHDARFHEYGLTPLGRRWFNGWERYHRDDVRMIIEPLPERARRQLVKAMRQIERILSRSALDNFKEEWIGPRKRAPYLTKARRGDRRKAAGASRFRAAAGR